LSSARQNPVGLDSNALEKKGEDRKIGGDGIATNDIMLVVSFIARAMLGHWMFATEN
jgi:hypothetical protein